MGAIVGHAKDTDLINCSNAAEVEGSFDLGGIAGNNTSSLFLGCANTGNIKGKSGNTGGICGRTGQEMCIRDSWWPAECRAFS